MEKGKLIILEGPDNTGKTTLCNNINEYLNKNGYKAKYYSFPGKQQGTVGKLVYDLHHNLSKYNIKAITPLAKQLLHIVAHIDIIEREILPLLKSGINIILDRYWWSTFVYGKLDGINPKYLKEITKFEKNIWGKYTPDCLLLISRKKIKNYSLYTEYNKLFNLEKGNYNIIEFENDYSLNTSIKKINKLIINIFLKEKNNQKYQSLYPIKTTAVYDTYWKFAAERQNIFFNRINNELVYTKDPILKEYKFTNTYRASDRVSQYLIKHIIYEGSQESEEVFFRIILFKIFNKIETWELLKAKLKEISYETFQYEKYEKILTNAINSGKRIYSAAYIMPSGGKNSSFNKKHQMHLKLIELMMENQLVDQVCEARTLQAVFELIRSYPSIGDFLAYQYTIDLNYSELINFNENDFVVPGPGAKDGIKKCFSDLGGLNDAEIIKIMAERQDEEFERLGITFKNLWGRKLHLIDCQNLFCEVDKYSRVAHPEISGITGRTKIKQKFKKNDNKIEFWYPPKWGINDKIKQEDSI